MSVQWYALQSKPRKEILLAEQLNLAGIESYFPFLRVKPVNPRSRKLLPYFPGYVFARLDLEQKTRVRLFFPGLAGMVCFGDIPAHVPDNLIHAIRRRVDEANAAAGKALLGLRPGDPVRIQAGPFKGYEAILDARLPGEARVRILLKYLNRPQIPLLLPLAQIQPINQ